ncbi:amidohydrolase family protein [Litoreibacter albidus]|uniref:L-fuconolactonase n=1 Tax=Litoreibacter albidus TaxID=670155 RepID=A0A1H3DGT0_9RHOB|nr:amidohydrolase family protein [Litoreibacter albidus]SDX65318.1 L-fuconolactonase [Litoreibacter albidus]
MIIDAHQHFWTLGRGDYPWPDASVAPIFKDFGPDDLNPALQQAGVSHTVLVQATDTVAETRFLLEIAAKTDFIAGVVGWVDLSADDAVETLTALAKDPMLKGVRPMLQNIAAEDWILGADCADAIEAMITLGLRFDALIQPRHLGAIKVLTQRYPDLQIVVDHGAKPEILPGVAPAALWRDGLAGLAESPSVYCKLSGLVTEARGDWDMADVATHGQEIIKCFGADRVMWGSDWPVVNLAADYAAWFRAVQSIASEHGPEAAAQIMGRTANRFYNLGLGE